MKGWGGLGRDGGLLLRDICEGELRRGVGRSDGRDGVAEQELGVGVVGVEAGLKARTYMAVGGWCGRV